MRRAAVIWLPLSLAAPASGAQTAGSGVFTISPQQCVWRAGDSCSPAPHKSPGFSPESSLIRCLGIPTSLFRGQLNCFPRGLWSQGNCWSPCSHSSCATSSAGDTLAFLSDGVVEARNARGELFGFERAAALSAQNAGQISRAARQFGQEDDITVLTLTLAAAGTMP